MKFKVGDTVKVIGPLFMDTCESGDIGVVVKCGMTFNYCYVKFFNGNQELLANYQIELVQPNEQ
jgi:hypothetical protein